LKQLVKDHFAILKVGPGLTFAFREAAFALALMEDELFSKEERSNLARVLDDVMVQRPEYWGKYYRGSEDERAFKRKYSLSDRLRYYWTDKQVQSALDKLIDNLHKKELPLSLVSQFAPIQYQRLRKNEIPNTVDAIIMDYVQIVLQDYEAACEG
jgi:D-tagatose-1,6-bisphosphate aldolase subunit GatZ/KbaZ